MVDVCLNCLFGELTTDQTLDREDGVGRVGHSLAFGRSANQDFAILHVSHDGRGRATAFGIFDNTNLVAIQHRYTAIGGSKVNTNDFAHDFLPD